MAPCSAWWHPLCARTGWVSSSDLVGLVLVGLSSPSRSTAAALARPGPAGSAAGILLVDVGWVVRVSRAGMRRALASQAPRATKRKFAPRAKKAATHAGCRNTATTLGPLASWIQPAAPSRVSTKPCSRDQAGGVPCWHDEAATTRARCAAHRDHCSLRIPARSQHRRVRLLA